MKKHFSAIGLSPLPFVIGHATATGTAYAGSQALVSALFENIKRLPTNSLGSVFLGRQYAIRNFYVKPKNVPSCSSGLFEGPTTSPDQQARRPFARHWILS
jgi:hypothetical protein